MTTRTTMMTSTASKKPSLSSSSSAAAARQELALNVLQSMKRQELGAYKIPTEYLEAILDAHQQTNVGGSITTPQQQRDNHDDGSSSRIMVTQLQLSTYLTWRRQMIEWCYRIAETCNFSKETVEISTNLLDRYVATNPMELMLDPTRYQLSCMSCLYTACKTNEPVCLSPQQMEAISGCGQYGSNGRALEIEETKILNALQWRVNPPTAIAFARNLLDAVDCTMATQTAEAILDAVEIQIEKSVPQELFLPIRPSGIAVAAVMNAIQGHLSLAQISKVRSELTKALYPSSHIRRRQQKLEKLQSSLMGLVSVDDHNMFAITTEESCVIFDNDRTYYTTSSSYDGNMMDVKKQKGNSNCYNHRAGYSPKSVAIRR